MSCIFCRIINGEIPCYKLYEDDKAIAFLDVSQSTFGHTLVLPKEHVENILSLDENLAGHLFSVATKISKKLNEILNPIGINIINNNKEPLQSVMHFHIHLIPRYLNDELKISFPNNYGKFKEEELTELINKLKF